MTAVHRRLRILIGLCGVGLLAFGLWLLLFQNRGGMKCIHVTPEDIRGELASLQALGDKEPGQPRRSVKLRLDFDASMAAGGVLAIRSNYQDRPLFLGPYVSEMTVYMDAKDLPADGSDSWQFTLFRPERGEVCIWPSDEGFPFWAGEKRLRIRLLKERQRLEDGRVRTYVVEPD